MTNRISARGLKNNINEECENVIMKKHLGATAVEIAHYIQLPLQTIQPFQVIIVAGTNDISYDMRENRLNEVTVVNNIVKIGKLAKDSGVSQINISSIPIRRGYQYKNIIKRINELLSRTCQENGFGFIDLSDITLMHIWDDGLHLNNDGLAIMKMNLLKCFFTFNPYVCDFMEAYENAL